MAMIGAGVVGGLSGTGSHRLRVALAILCKNQFRCPYCNESTRMEVRHVKHPSQDRVRSRCVKTCRRGTVMNGEELSCWRSDGSTHHELGGHQCLFQILATSAYIFRPAQDAEDRRAQIPADVRNGRHTPGKGGIGIRAKNGNVLRHPDALPGQKLLACGENGWFIEKKRGRSRDLEQ